MEQRLLKKSETIPCRTDADTKAVLRKAAKLSGLDVSAYVISKSKDAAISDIIRHEQVNRILFNDADFAQAKAIIESPAKATSQLKAAMKKHLKK